jgi:hypothetical protein
LDPLPAAPPPRLCWRVPVVEHGDLSNRLNEPRARSIPNIAKFATAVVQLHQDSSVARDAIAAFEAATANEQRACLTFILFKDCRP